MLCVCLSETYSEMPRHMMRTPWKLFFLVFFAILALLLGCLLITSSDLFLQREEYGEDETLHDLVDVIAAMGREQPPLRREQLAGQFARQLRPWLLAWRELPAPATLPSVPVPVQNFRLIVRERTHEICTVADIVMDDVIAPNVMDDETKTFFRVFQGDLLTACAEVASPTERMLLFGKAGKMYRTARGLALVSLEASHPLRQMLSQMILQDENDAIVR